MDQIRSVVLPFTTPGRRFARIANLASANVTPNSAAGHNTRMDGTAKPKRGSLGPKREAGFVLALSVILGCVVIIRWA